MVVVLTFCQSFRATVRISDSGVQSDRLSSLPLPTTVDVDEGTIEEEEGEGAKVEVVMLVLVLEELTGVAAPLDGT